MSRPNHSAASRAQRQTAHNMGWGAIQIARLRALAADGLSASDIARSMNVVSRSAVLSIMRRKGIALKGATGSRPTRVAEPVIAEAAEIAAEPVVEVVREPVTTLALKRGECKWPYGDGPFFHCGAPARGPYCAEHRARSYSKSHRDAVA